MKHPSRPPQAGFSLLELMLASAIFSISVISLAWLFGIGTQVNSRSRVKSFAVSLAQSKLEQLEAVASFDDPQLAAGGALPPNAPQASYTDNLDANGVVVSGSGLFTRQWKIDALSPNLKQITVAVTVNGPVLGGVLTVSITTLRARG